MFAAIADFLRLHAREMAAAITLLVLWLVYRRNRDDASFWLTDLRYRIPLFGQLARLAGDPSPSQLPGWYKAERTLCMDYFKHFNPMKQQQFDNHLEYLRKAYDRGRTPMPMWLILFIGALVIAEGLGFSYLLGALMAIDASENLRTVMMFAITLVLSGILLLATHRAGHQLYRTRLLKACLRRIRGSGGLSRSVALNTISLDLDQSQDDGEDEAVQCIRRVKAGVDDTGSYVWVYVALFLTLAVFAGSTWLRAAHFETTLTHSVAAEASDPFADGGAPAAPAKIAGEAGQAETSEAMAGFLLLGVIFVVTQAVSAGCGHHYGFGGKEGAKAYKETEGHANFESYWRRYQHRLNIAQARLQDLQQQLEAPRVQEFKTTKTFADFVMEQESSPVAAVYTGRVPPAPGAPPPDEAVDRAIKRLKGTRLATERTAIVAMLSPAEKSLLKTRLRQIKTSGDAAFAAEIEALL